MTADLVAGTALLPVAALSLREVKHWRELPFALLPAIFALHQYIESIVWAGLNGHVSAGLEHAAVFAYLLIALPLLPTLFPLSILMLEPRGARLRVAPFVVLGAVVSTYFTVVLITDPVGVTSHPYCLAYQTGAQNMPVWATLYVVAVIGPALMSGYPSIVAFGVLNLIGLVVAAALYVQAFASLWCVYAAIMSVLVLVHMVRRRRLPDPHRYHGQPLVPLNP
ncbi:DUF6629 family protein [Nocardia sp. NPDC006630]|uniref:DUF6629 family protein n=1 Tax=Nocardia sp. NPDC006630 TaxID=3157181 RepID=UPI0033ACF09C